MVDNDKERYEMIFEMIWVSDTIYFEWSKICLSRKSSPVQSIQATVHRQHSTKPTSPLSSQINPQNPIMRFVSKNIYRKWLRMSVIVFMEAQYTSWTGWVWLYLLKHNIPAGLDECDFIYWSTIYKLDWVSVIVFIKAQYTSWTGWVWFSLLKHNIPAGLDECDCIYWSRI